MQKIIVSFRDGTPSTVIDKAIQQVESKGGSINHRYDGSILGFAATLHADSVHLLTTEHSEHIESIEEDGKRMLILVLSELEMPSQSIDLPTKFKKLLLPGKIQATLCLDNQSPTTTQYLLQTSPILVTSDVFESHGWRLGLRTQALDQNDNLAKNAFGRKYDCHVVISKGDFSAIHDERILLSPGSATGIRGEPSFLLMDLSDDLLVLYIYKLVLDQVKVDKLEFLKPKFD